MKWGAAAVPASKGNLHGNPVLFYALGPLLSKKEVTGECNVPEITTIIDSVIFFCNFFFSIVHFPASPKENEPEERAPVGCK
jgi:hypothetical protein